MRALFIVSNGMQHDFPHYTLFKNTSLDRQKDYIKYHQMLNRELIITSLCWQ